jgi:hypothetical protein
VGGSQALKITPRAWSFPKRATHSGGSDEMRSTIRRPEFQRLFAIPSNLYFQKQYFDKGDFLEYPETAELKQRPPADSAQAPRLAGGRETKPSCKALINLDSRT